VSTRAKAAIGLDIHRDLELKEGDPADLVVFGSAGERGFRHRRTIQEVVYDPGSERVTIFGGRIVTEMSSGGRLNL